ncbi:MAG: hypothetical protein M3N39_05375 [Pseudomonadota bacterium]|nr:hypothetical protein [Pseudomonadota bacterium]
MLASLTALPLEAQSLGDPLVRVTRYDVDMSDEDAFADYMRHRVEAARLAGLRAEQGWRTLRSDNTWLVIEVPTAAAGEVAGAEPLAMHVKGTAGEPVLRRADELLANISFQRERSLFAAPSSLRHEPRNPAPANFAFVQEFRVVPGAESARQEFVAFLREVSLPYRYEALRPVFGRDVVMGIVWPDDLTRYYSQFSPAVFMQRYPDRFRPLAQRLRSVTRDQETRLYSVRPEFSYPTATP